MTTTTLDPSDSKIIIQYKEFTLQMLQYTFPDVPITILSDAVDYSIIKRCQNADIVLENNYKNRIMNSSVLDLVEYVLTLEPIITPNGVMYKQPEDEDNPLDRMIQSFLKTRKGYKKQMFKYPKGSEEFDHFNLLQLLSKQDANAVYGCLGNWSAIYYNVYTAESITSCGRSSISAAGLAFEQFLANNVKFRKLDEILVFINHVVSEEPIRKYNDNMILDHDIPLEDAFTKIMSTCGHGYMPVEEDLEIVWDVMSKLTQRDLNRLFYKNNLLAFADNKYISGLLVKLLTLLDEPWLDCNEVPKEISTEIDCVWDLFEEYVYYGYQVIDRQDRLEFLPRKVTLVIDTDSEHVMIA